MSEQGERAVRGDTHALRYATRELPCGTKAGRAVVERVQSERGTIAPHALRYATRTTMRMKGEHHEIPYATPKRGVPSWSACDSGAEREHPRAPLRYAHSHAAGR